LPLLLPLLLLLVVISEMRGKVWVGAWQTWGRHRLGVRRRRRGWWEVVLV
jgi:hypothetical protein